MPGKPARNNFLSVLSGFLSFWISWSDSEWDPFKKISCANRKSQWGQIWRPQWIFKTLMFVFQKKIALGRQLWYPRSIWEWFWPFISSLYYAYFLCRLWVGGGGNTPKSRYHSSSSTSKMLSSQTCGSWSCRVSICHVLSFAAQKYHCTNLSYLEFENCHQLNIMNLDLLFRLNEHIKLFLLNYGETYWRYPQLKNFPCQRHQDTSVPKIFLVININIAFQYISSVRKFPT
jgi:hypothetical protein